MSWQHSLWRAVARLRARAGSAAPPGLRTMTYHSVGSVLAQDPYGTAMSEAVFRSHVEVLAALAPVLPAVPLAVPADDAPRLAVTFDDGYKDTLTRAAPLLAARAIPFTVFVPAAHVEHPEGLYLDKAALRELASVPGASIGAHGERHVRLTSLNDAALARELSASRSKLEDWLGRPVTAMSYPYGVLDRRVRDAVAAAGFTLAATSRYGTSRAGGDPLLLRRTEAVAWDGPEELRLKATGAWDLFALRQGEPA